MEIIILTKEQKQLIRLLEKNNSFDDIVKKMGKSEQEVSEIMDELEDWGLIGECRK